MAISPVPPEKLPHPEADRDGPEHPGRRRRGGPAGPSRPQL